MLYCARQHGRHSGQVLFAGVCACTCICVTDRKEKKGEQDLE